MAANRKLIQEVKSQGLLFEELAIMTSIFEGHLMHAAAGRRELTLSEQERVADCLGRTREELFSGNG